MNKYVLQVASDVSQQRIRCLGSLKNIAEAIRSPELPMAKVDEALDQLGSEIGRLRQLKADYQSLRVQAEACGDIKREGE